MKATTISLDNDTLGRIDGLANNLSRSRSWVINQAIERFLDYEEWFVEDYTEEYKDTLQNALNVVQSGLKTHYKNPELIQLEEDIRRAILSIAIA